MVRAEAGEGPGEGDELPGLGGGQPPLGQQLLRQCMEQLRAPRVGGRAARAPTPYPPRDLSAQNINVASWRFMIGGWLREGEECNDSKKKTTSCRKKEFPSILEGQTTSHQIDLWVLKYRNSQKKISSINTLEKLPSENMAVKTIVKHHCEAPGLDNPGA